MLVLFYIFFVGLFLGSFLLVVINRYCSGKSFVRGRSECDFCHHTLSLFDLFPVLSYLFLQGKCRYCHKKLSLLYPLAEIVTAMFFTFSFSQLYNFNTLPFSLFQLTSLAFTFFFLGTCILTFFIDLKIGIIPFFAVIPCVLFLIVKNSVFPFSAASFYLQSGFGSFLFLFLILLVTKGRGMGFGDCVYALLMGLLLGFPNSITAFYIAFLTGAIVSLILILWGKKKLKNGTIPFGPFLVLGTYVTFLYGDLLTRYFFKIILH